MTLAPPPVPLAPEHAEAFRNILGCIQDAISKDEGVSWDAADRLVNLVHIIGLSRVTKMETGLPFSIVRGGQ